MTNTIDIVGEIFLGNIKDDIVYFMQDNYTKVNKKEVREELNLSNRSTASNFSDKNWATLKDYIKDKNMGQIIETRNKKRWQINGLSITINKVDENLKPSNPYIDNSDQLKMDLGIPAQDVTIDHPIVIGYVPDTTRSIIMGIYVIKYLADGNVDWNIPLYVINNSQEQNTNVVQKDIKSLIKVKKPLGNIVELFDKDE